MNPSSTSISTNAYQNEGHTLKTLIIDDEEDMHYLLKNILKQRGITTVSAGTINEALAYLKDHYDIFLIFLDNRLPDGIGYQYIARLRELTKASIVMVTAYDTSYDKKMARESGADDFIGKPFSKEIILNVVDRILHDRISRQIKQDPKKS